MPVIWLLAFLITEGILWAQQGVYIPPRNTKSQPTIVNMSIGDNIVPLVEIGPNGPTVVKFPGKVVTVVIDSGAYYWKEIAPKNLPGGGKLFSYIAFSESKALTKEQKEHLAKNNITAVVIYLYKGTEYVHDIDLVRRPKHRRSFVALVPTSKGVPDNSYVMESFSKKFRIIDRTIKNNKDIYRIKSDKIKTFKNHGFKVEEPK